MKLSEIRNAYEDLSGSLSRFNRQLAFAGIGIVWLFRTTTENGTTIEPAMLTPVLCFVISLAFDILQYFWQSYVWYIYYWYKSGKGAHEDDEMNEPEWPNLIAWGLFTFKVCALISAYIHLGLYLYQQLF